MVQIKAAAAIEIIVAVEWISGIGRKAEAISVWQARPVISVTPMRMVFVVLIVFVVFDDVPFMGVGVMPVIG
jgi:hypothetical protein